MEAQEKENPNEESTNGVPYGFQRDQPPGTMDQMGRVQVLERPVSPRVLDNPRALKKDSKAVDGVELDGGANVTYTAMVAKSISTDRNSSKVFSFTNEEVEIIDEDCLVDESEAFSTIKLSDRVHDHIDCVTVDDDARIVHERNVHGGGSVPMRVKVVSLVEDGTANVLVHNVGSKMGKHVAVSVMERVLCRNMVRDHKRRFFYLSSIPKRIRDEARRMHHGLEQSHDAMVDDDPVKSHPEVVDNVHDPLHGAKFLMGC
ncbi:hypothetical protein V6N12_042366 [Hibiscus sabdariffa]|uniref:Uncharacterized protein n=1 Tax=Hibiscus sabdariffa TaxID=183260 RepID=A0ABR2EEK3_9ROSI